MADAREYETVYILQPDLPAAKVDKVRDRVLKILTENKAEVLHQKDWGKRKLSYRIGKYLFGQYFYFNYLGEGQFIQEVERILKYEEDVVRYMTVKMEIANEKDRTGKLKRVTLPEEAKLKTDDSRPFYPREFDGARESRNVVEKGVENATEN